MDGWQRLAERRIREAQMRGEFDNLPGKGKPLPPDPFAHLPDEVRVSARLLASSGVVPEEVTTLRELGEARERLQAAETPEEKDAAMREYTAAELRANIAMERWNRLLSGRI